MGALGVAVVLGSKYKPLMEKSARMVQSFNDGFDEAYHCFDKLPNSATNRRPSLAVKREI